MNRPFARYAWGTTAVVVAVIAGGAIVRATGSGAGCGSNWPQCNGTIVPGGTTEAIIEFTHRATSALSFLLVLVLFLWARRLGEARLRTGATASLIFMVGEVLIGAALVLGEWVADDTSVARAVIDGFHLVNTLFLLGALTLTAWWAGGGGALRTRNLSTESRLLVGGLVALVVVSAAGALTALGDTLFPDATIGDDFSSSSHFLVRMRVIHPVLAVMTALYLIGVTRRVAGRFDGTVFQTAVIGGSLIGAQVFIGVVNLALGAPVWMQVVHLLVTDALWISLVLLSVMTMQQERVAVYQ